MATATEATLPATRFLEQPKRMLIDGESRFRPERRPLRSGTDVRSRYGRRHPVPADIRTEESLT